MILLLLQKAWPESLFAIVYNCSEMLQSQNNSNSTSCCSEKLLNTHILDKD